MALLGLVLGLTMVTLSAILNGWVASVLWVWFMVPFGLPPISVAHAIGVLLTIRMFAYAPAKDPDPPLEVFAKLLAKPVLVLFIGWVVKGFMS